MYLPLTPIRCLYRGVDLFGKKTGVVCGTSQFTYAEFGERCERLAAGLLGEGVQPGDRIAYLSFDTHQLLEGYFGVLLAGCVAMPLNVRLTVPELACILNHARPRVLFYEPEFADTVGELRRAVPGLRCSIEMSAPYEQFLEQGRIERPYLSDIDEHQVAELFYTSGSTGTPKGVMLTHRSLYLHAMSCAITFASGDDAVELHTIPLFHANGWGRAHTSVMLGLKQVMVRRFDPPTVLRLIEQEKATGMALVPTMANALLQVPEIETRDLSSMRRIMLGGAAASPELIERLEKAFGCRIEAGYGLTESGPVATGSRPKSTIVYANEEDRLRRLSMAGWPVPGCEVRVVDENLRDVPRDLQSVGEIVMRGDNIMEGYFEEPDATAAILQGGWLHTGDMAVWDEENYIQIVDRKKDIIVSGGENISSIEVERAIAAHPAVLECAVVAAPEPRWGEVPAAFVVLKPGHTREEQQLCEFLQGGLARFKMPRQIHFTTDALPKTGTGKIVKRQLRETFWQGKERRVQG